MPVAIKVCLAGALVVFRILLSLDPPKADLHIYKGEGGSEIPRGGHCLKKYWCGENVCRSQTALAFIRWWGDGRMPVDPARTCGPGWDRASRSLPAACRRTDAALTLLPLPPLCAP